MASYSDRAADVFLPERLETGAGGGGAGETGGGGSDARLREEPTLVGSLDSKNNSASSVGVLLSEGVGDGLRGGRKLACWWSGVAW